MLSNAWWQGSVLILAFSQCITCSLSIIQRSQDDPQQSGIIRRSNHKIAVLDDYLYIDGGEYSKKINGSYGASGQTSRSNNVTLALPLSQPWSNLTVTYHVTAKTGLEIVNYEALWVDEITKTLFSWGGEAQFGKDRTASDFYKFVPDGNGGGQWSVQEPSQPDHYDDLRLASLSSTTSCGDTGYSFGGFISSWTDPRVQNYTGRPLPELRTYNMTTNTWSSYSATGFSADGTSIAGSAVCLPYGAQGLVMFLGGLSSSPSDFYYESKATMIQFGNVSFWDPAGKTWYSQSTIGTTPSPREDACLVGVQSPNNTYEIYMYGGYNKDQDLFYNELWILSLPGFVWTKVRQDSTAGRRKPQCKLIGQRQMIVVGGLGQGDGSDPDWLDQDPWAQGIAIFDLPTLTWSNAYDPNAAAYQSPQIIQDWYSANGNGSVSWTSESVKSLFISNTSTSDGVQSTPTDTASGDQKDNSSTNNKTAIIAGSSVGGVAAIAIVAIIIVYTRRQRRKSSALKYPESKIEPQSDHWSDQQNQTRFEVPAIEPIVEVPAWKTTQEAPQEIQGRPINHELPA